MHPPPRILDEHWSIYYCLQIPPRENWFQYVRRVYTTAINFPCITSLDKQSIKIEEGHRSIVTYFANKLVREIYTNYTKLNFFIFSLVKLFYTRTWVRFNWFLFIIYLTLGLKEIKTFCCTQPGDFYFLKLHVSTKLRSYKTKFSFGDFWNKSNFRTVNELGHKSYCKKIPELSKIFVFCMKVATTWNTKSGIIEGFTMMF